MACCGLVRVVTTYRNGHGPFKRPPGKFELMLNAPVNSHGHVRTLPRLSGTFRQA